MPHKESSQENSCPKAGFNGRYEVAQEKEGEVRARHGLFIEEGG
jgi:hypothetical protein